MKPKAVELSIFPPDTEVIHNMHWGSAAYRQDPESAFMTNDKFIRSVEIIPPLLSLKSLERLLAIADKELEVVAEIC